MASLCVVTTSRADAGHATLSALHLHSASQPFIDLLSCVTEKGTLDLQSVASTGRAGRLVGSTSKDMRRSKSIAY